MRTWVAGLIALAGCAGGGGLRLEARPPAVDQTVTVTVSSELDFELVTYKGLEENIQRLSQEMTETFEQTLAADQTLSIRCVGSEVRLTRTSGIEKKVSPLGGRTFQVRRSESGAIRLSDGSPLPVNCESLGGWEEYVRLLPPTAVKVGDTWRVKQDVAGLLTLGSLTDTTQVEVVAQLISINGDEATIAFQGGFEGAIPGGRLKMLISDGSMVFDMKRKLPRVITLTGEASGTHDASENFPKGFRSHTRKLQVRIEMK